jgi:hypothetical protein
MFKEEALVSLALVRVPRLALGDARDGCRQRRDVKSPSVPVGNQLELTNGVGLRADRRYDTTSAIVRSNTTTISQ